MGYRVEPLYFPDSPRDDRESRRDLSRPTADSRNESLLEALEGFDIPAGEPGALLSIYV